VFKPFEERDAQGLTADAILASINQRLAKIDGAFVITILPPPINGIGNAGGFKMMLEDRKNLGPAALEAAAQELAAAANADPRLSGVFTPFTSTTPKLYADIESLSEPLEIVFADNTAVKNPHRTGTTVFALHRIEHLLQRGHISPIAFRDFVGKRKTFRSHHQRKNQLFAVGSLIVRVTVAGFIDLLDFAFKVGARQIVKQNIEAGTEEIFPASSQMYFQGFLVLDYPVQRAIESILFSHLLVTVEQSRHRCLWKPLLVNRKLAARCNESIDRQKLDHFVPRHRAGLLPKDFVPELSQSEFLPQLASCAAGSNCRGRRTTRLERSTSAASSGVASCRQLPVPITEESHLMTPPIFLDHVDRSPPALKLRGVQFTQMRYLTL
jgi:AcrB/AcrD/AcrF family protein